MDWLQFFSSLVASLAWPVATVLIVVLLRRAILRLLPRLRKLKYGEIEAEFGEKLEEVEEEVAGLPTPTSLPEAAARTEELQRAGDFSTNSAVFIAWLPVETALLNLARAVNVLEPNMPPWVAQRALLKREVIDSRTHEAIRDLRNLRNIAVHPGEGRLITHEEATRFTKLAEKIAGVLEDKLRALRESQ